MPALLFDLPRELEAAGPPEARGLPRDGVALLVSDANSGSHRATTFAHLDEYLHAGDLLVVNDSATIPAALDARRENGETFTLHLSTRIDAGLWIVEPRASPDLRTGERLTLAAGGSAWLLKAAHRGTMRLWYAMLALPVPVEDYLARHGRPIAYPYVSGIWPLNAYQTLFARLPGSVEMPSAGRPFTPRIVARLRRRGVGFAAITLHCGVASSEAHEPPPEEFFEVSAPAVEAVERTHRSGGRVIAIGTTVVRALESALDDGGTLHPLRGWTRRIVDPAHPPRVTGGLLTGLHEPRASHLLMLESFASRAFLQEAYGVALRERLLWHEFGDVHLLVRAPGESAA